ncbi:MAG: hypothetical protein CMJ04_02565 [Pelagibacteraceae bacterium]|nr:hypothetical protein [Pelagibacteraceae bacterium]
MKNTKTAFITFFSVIPDNMGSSTVVNSRFKSWPSKKKLFQLSHIKKINNKNTKTIFIKKEKPLNKIFSLPELIFSVFLYLKSSKNKIIVIEGASWIFYSFLVFFLLKLIFIKSKIIYISHSIESEIRKKFSNTFIYLLTKYLEGLMFKYVDISTSVSKYEKSKIKKLYNVNTILYPNAINIDYKVGIKKITKDYILYSGSYLYRPNKNAIDYLNNNIMPILLTKHPKIKLLLTGGGLKKKYPWVINKNIIPKKELYNLIYHSKCLCVPLKFGSGTRIKIIEALSIGAIVISSSKGIEGIELNKKNPPFVLKNNKKFINTIDNVIKNNRSIKKKSIIAKNFYLKKYLMRKITNNFLKNCL